MKLVAASPSNQIYVIMDAGTPAAFVNRHEMKAYLRRLLDVFINPLVYTFEGHMPTIMTMSKALAK